MTLPSQFIPILGTLIGVLLGGMISIITTRYAGKNQKDIAIQNLAEARAIWAAERKIDKLNSLYGAVEQLSDHAMEYRIRKAHESHNPNDIPNWVKSAYDARNDIENSIANAQNQAYLLDEDIVATFEAALEPWKDAFLEIDSKKVLEHLMKFESALFKLKRSIAATARSTFENRQAGSDIVLG